MPGERGLEGDHEGLLPTPLYLTPPPHLNLQFRDELITRPRHHPPGLAHLHLPTPRPIPVLFTLVVTTVFLALSLRCYYKSASQQSLGAKGSKDKP